MSIPYKPNASSLDFYIPSTLISDFDAFVEHDIPDSVMSFENYHDWTTGEHYTIRGMIYPQSVKSRYENMTNTNNFRARKKDNIRIGDILQNPDGIYYLLDWKVQPEPNNSASRALECNIYLTIKRHVDETVDARGFVITEAHDEDIVSSLPANISRSEYRIEYSVLNTSPGLSPNTIAVLYVQVNPQTKNIRIGDKFVWNGETSMIIDIDPVDMDITGEFGILKLQARKLPGNEMNFS